MPATKPANSAPATFSGLSNDAIDTIPMKARLLRVTLGFFLSLRQTPQHAQSVNSLSAETVDKLGGMAGIW